MFRCQERNSERDWGTTAGNIPFRSLGSPLSLVQESIIVLRKCAVQVPEVDNHSNGYPKNIQLFWVEIQTFESQDSCLSAPTHFDFKRLFPKLHQKQGNICWKHRLICYNFIEHYNSICSGMQQPSSGYINPRTAT